jgi:nitric oxide synthase-interacting protein
MAGYGTKKLRLGSDSQIPFGHCCLGLCAAVDPVVTPYGHVYSRDAIIENLAEQTKENKRQQVAFEEFIKKRKREDDEEEHKEKQRKLEEFEALETKSAIAPQLHAELSLKETRKETAGFWVPAHAPEAKATDVPPPRKSTLCPMTSKPLKLKDLIPVKLDWEQDSSFKVGPKARVLCAVSQKPITFQKVFCIRPSGIVVLETAFKEVIEPVMICPVSGKKLKKEDIIELVAGGTSFSAHNSVEASSYRPNI